MFSDVLSRWHRAGSRCANAGFTLTRRGEHVFLGHLGAVAGYAAHAMIDPPSKTGLIVLRNAAGGTFDVPGLTFGAMTEARERGNAGEDVVSSH